MAAVTAPSPARPFAGRFLRGRSDEQLVARLRAGDDAAFETIYDRHHRELLAYCRHMLGSREEAEDAVQHAMVSAYRALRADDRDVSLRPWLYAVARNRCLSMLRARREHAELSDALPAADAPPAQAERRAELQALLEDLRGLPQDQREALVLAELGALSHDEIAEVLGVRTQKVKALVFQAREALVASRAARETDCREIREQLATLTGGALRRAPLRRHLATCAGCRAFRADVRRQRVALGALLPVVPSAALKGQVLGAIAAIGGGAGGAGGAGGLGAGAAVGAGAGAAGAASSGILGGLAGGGLTGKAIVAAVLAAGAGAGGITALHVHHEHAHHAAVEAKAAPAPAAHTLVARPALLPVATLSRRPRAVPVAFEHRAVARRHSPHAVHRRIVEPVEPVAARRPATPVHAPAPAAATLPATASPVAVEHVAAHAGHRAGGQGRPALPAQAAPAAAQPAARQAPAARGRRAAGGADRATPSHAASPAGTQPPADAQGDGAAQHRGDHAGRGGTDG